LLFELFDERTEHLVERYRPVNQPIEVGGQTCFIIDVCILFSLHNATGLLRFDPFQLCAKLFFNEILLGLQELKEWLVIAYIDFTTELVILRVYREAGVRLGTLRVEFAPQG
jgi:hypothetical protein